MWIAGFCRGENRTHLGSDNYWLGLLRTANGYEWNDGNPSTYRNWSLGEPDDNDVCTVYTKDGFKDTSCWALSYYTCKKSAGNVYANCLTTQCFGDRL